MNLWLKLPNATHQIVSFNTFLRVDGNVWEFWVMRTNGKTLLVAEGTEDDIQIIKDMFDTAVATNDSIVELM